MSLYNSATSSTSSHTENWSVLFRICVAIAASMACHIAVGHLRRVRPEPVERSAAPHVCRQRRHPRRLVLNAAAVDTQRTPVKVNQLLIAKHEEQLITTGQQVSSADDSQQREVPSQSEESTNIGPTEFGEQSTPYDAEHDWHERFGHYGSNFEGSVGAYTMWSPRQNLAGSRGQDDPEQQWHGLRAAKASDDANAMHFVNLYDRQLPGENRNQLEHGLWQSSWVYTKASTVSQEGFFHPYVDTEGPLRARTIGTSPADLTTCRFSLPYKHLLPSEEAASVGDMWNCEMSMLDVDKRGWMLGPMYNMCTGQLMALMHAREYPLGLINVDDPRDVTLSPPLQPPRHRLAGPPSTWLTGDWQGTVSSLTFHPDGQITRSPTRSCHWVPPNNSATDSFLYALYTMPDCCYIFCPILIPTDHTTMPMAGMSIQSGCLNGAGRFQRTTLKYSQDGRLTHMVHEKYVRWAAGDTHTNGSNGDGGKE